MNVRNLKVAAGLAAALLAVNTQAQADITAFLVPISATQVGTEGIIRFGTVVSARTNLNAIWASANYRIECSEAAIRPALTGSRGWSNNGFVGPRNIYVTAPEWVPAEQALPGWQNVMGGTFVTCVHTHWGAARTHILPIGSGGTSFPIGGESWDHSESSTFGMIKPGDSFGGGCIM